MLPTLAAWFVPRKEGRIFIGFAPILASKQARGVVSARPGAKGLVHFAHPSPFQTPAMTPSSVRRKDVVAAIMGR